MWNFTTHAIRCAHMAVDCPPGRHANMYNHRPAPATPNFTMRFSSRVSHFKRSHNILLVFDTAVVVVIVNATRAGRSRRDARDQAL
ncbi:hypothetical protein J1614_010706 [Plenodomus biglobosus]|nr:hypothetical protein J1614_010706 [Plenodomus biglobosus]